MTEQKFKIIKIIDDQNIVIAGGEEDSVKEGDRFIIVDKNSEELFDPDTGQSLGYLYKDKGVVTASRVYERLSVLETPYTGFSVFGTSNFPTPTRQSRLSVNEEQITGGLEANPVSIGDFARKISN